MKTAQEITLWFRDCIGALPFIPLHFIHRSSFLQQMQVASAEQIWGEPAQGLIPFPTTLPKTRHKLFKWGPEPGHWAATNTLVKNAHSVTLCFPDFSWFVLLRGWLRDLTQCFAAFNPVRVWCDRAHRVFSLIFGHWHEPAVAPVLCGCGDVCWCALWGTKV